MRPTAPERVGGIYDPFQIIIARLEVGLIGHL